MLDYTLALVGAGPLPELLMREGGQHLADRFSAEMVPLACGSEPHSLLEALASRPRGRNHPTFLRLSGDAAMAQGSSGSWLDALAAWRCPVLLLVQPNAAVLGDAAGEAVELANAEIAVEEEINPMFLFQPGVDLREIVEAVNQVGASPSSLIAILEALKSSGSLRAELLVI